jgi:hypothetical protein
MSQYDPGYQQPYAPQPPQAPRRSNGRIACIGCLGVIGLILIIGAVGAASRSSSSSAAPPAEGQAAQPVQAAPPAHTTAAAPPTTTAAAAAAKPAVVATFHGSGSQNTAPFTVTATWQLAYAFDCTSAYGSNGLFQVYEYDGNTPKDILANDLGTSKQANSWAYDGPGTRHLNINSDCAWTVEVVDEG